MIALDISWNNIQMKGGVALSEALTVNGTLKIIDMSFNSIGISKKKGHELEENLQIFPKLLINKLKSRKRKNDISAALYFSNMFEKNNTLVHCDISQCEFSKIECKVMSKGLNQNHTILGLHTAGNELNTNSLGFLKEENAHPGKSHILQKFSKNELNGGKNMKKLNMDVTSNCWICESWVQTKVLIDISQLNIPISHKLTEKDQILIHYSFDNFEPDILTQSGNTGEYLSLRMVSLLIIIVDASKTCELLHNS